MKGMGYIGMLAVAVLLLGAATLIPQQVSAQTLTVEQRAKLQAEYDQLQQEIAQWQKILDETKAKKNTLTGDVSALTAQISKAQKEIQQRSTVISRLGSEINEKTSRIQTLESRIDEGRASLAKLLRQKHEAESQSLIVLVLSTDDLSTFFSDSEDIDVVNRELQAHFAELRGVKQETEKEKLELDARKNAELDARHEIQLKQSQIKENQEEKKQLLAITRKDEQSYQAVLSERQKRANEIRNALFELRDTQGISFQSALEYANEAEQVTGVRAAFILGILRQESNLGVNVGQCLLVDPATGSGKGKNTGKAFENLMKVNRDVQPFLTLMAQLGRDPYTTPVSCPIGNLGYGGAMGPSQFIASTWVSIESRIERALGVATVDPWNPRHAVMATAVYLSMLNPAGGKGYSAEREKAARYYAGGNWRSLGLNYAASVLNFAEKYQKDIDFLSDN